MRTREAVYFAGDRSVVVLKLIDRLTMLVWSWLEYRQRRADRDLLMRMSERELKDIGLFRCDIDHLMRP